MVGWPVIRRPTVPTHAALDSVAVPVPATAIDQRRVLVTRPPFFHRVRTCARRWQLSRSFPRTKLKKRIAAYRCKSLRNCRSATRLAMGPNGWEIVRSTCGQSPIRLRRA